MAVIRDYKNGNCRIIVHDDNIQPPDEVERIIERVSRIIIQEEIRKNLENKKAN